ncbi:type II toxin-antitoxin system PemK/MazF family toxin [Pectobacterium brasiliense]|nr:type II toxin-antitoxin system PemK/MazF family toxin [Pectobacterium brasiliense]
MMARTPKKGEVWLVNPDPIAGKEIAGPHYFLVISVDTVNKETGVTACAAITSGAGSLREKNIVVYIGGGDSEKGKVTGVILCHQLNSLDFQARGARYIDTVSPQVMADVEITLANILGI